MCKLIDLTGMKFGRWEVIERGDVSNGEIKWHCICDCGTTRQVIGIALRRGGSRSCGCLHNELASIRSRKLMTTHGLHVSRTHNIWGGMKQRCGNTNSKDYHRYGGRGIKVCDRWLKFENFLEDMGECPDGLSIERIDNNGNYELSNCKWATMKEQARNTRKSILLTYRGATKTLIEWAEEFNINKSTLKARIKRGWTTERAMINKDFRGKEVSHRQV